MKPSPDPHLDHDQHFGPSIRETLSLPVLPFALPRTAHATESTMRALDHKDYLSRLLSGQYSHLMQPGMYKSPKHQPELSG